MSGRAAVWTEYTTRFYAWREGIDQNADSAVALIAERPVVITVVRQDPVTHVKTTLTPQTVRIDLDARLIATERVGTGVSSAYTSKQKIIVLGYRNAAGYVDTDLKFGDYFQYQGQQMVIKKVETNNLDRLLAEAEAEG